MATGGGGRGARPDMAAGGKRSMPVCFRGAAMLVRRRFAAEEVALRAPAAQGMSVGAGRRSLAAGKGLLRSEGPAIMTDDFLRLGGVARQQLGEPSMEGAKEAVAAAGVAAAGSQGATAPGKKKE